MPLKLYPPGSRKGNKTYYAVGRIGGRQYEVNTHQSDARTARKVADGFERGVRDDLERQQREGAAPEAAEPAAAALMFGEVAERYMAAKDASRNDRRYIARLIGALGTLPVADITPVHIEEAAAALYPGCTAATRNRQAFVPAAAILHWAADAGWCAYTRVRKLRETRPRKRRPPSDAMLRLIAAAEDPHQRLFLLILWAHGWRITETLAISWEANVRLVDQEFDMYIRKVDAWKIIPMHPNVFEALAAIPEQDRRGQVFPWGGDRHAVYRWLDPLLLSVGLAEIVGWKVVSGGWKGEQRRPIIKRTLTPHMARHAFASELNALGETDSSIAAAGTWMSPETVRKCYTDVSASEQRATLARRGTLGEALGENGKRDGSTG